MLTNELYRCDKKQMKLLNQVKKKTLECFSLGMLPKELCKRVYELDMIINKSYFDFLHKATEDFLRIKGYYHNKENMDKGNKLFLNALNIYYAESEVN